MDIYILRDGKEIGPFNEETTQTLLKQGAVLINDLAWQPGMAQWGPLHSVLYPGPACAPDGARPELADPAIHSPTPITSEPATAKQKALLSYMGAAFSTDLTKDQAARLVNDTMENPADAGRLERWNHERLRLYPELFQAEIQAKKENRPNHFHEITKTEGGDVFNNVTKAHCQVLVGFLDVRFPNWDAHEHQAIWDYFFPAIAEKFPQLLRKEWKRKLKYPEGPKVAPELARHAGVVKPKRRSFPAAILVRATGAGVATLIVLYAGYQFATRKPWLKWSEARPNATPVTKSAGKGAVVESGKTAASGVDLEKLFAQNPIADPAAPDLSTQAPATGVPMNAAAPEAGPPAEAATASSPTAAPLFDATAHAAVPGTAPEPLTIQRTNLVITKPVDVPLRFGHARLAPGTVVKFVGQDGALLRVRYGGEVVVVPAGSTDFLGAPPVALSPSGTPNPGAANSAAPAAPAAATVPSPTTAGSPPSLF
jgi:hypothetical protein